MTATKIYCTVAQLSCLLACLGFSAPATAQEQVSRFEITPYAAYRMGGSFDEQDGTGRVDLNDSSAEGILFNIAANPNGQYEFLYARQGTDADTSGFFADDPTIDLDVEYLHFGAPTFSMAIARARLSQ
jgi:hypothetical protein